MDRQPPNQLRLHWPGLWQGATSPCRPSVAVLHRCVVRNTRSGTTKPCAVQPYLQLPWPWLPRMTLRFIPREDLCPFLLRWDRFPAFDTDRNGLKGGAGVLFGYVHTNLVCTF